MNDIDLKILSALERIAQIMRALAWENAKLLSINPVQAQILIFLLHHPGRHNGITILAKEFTISKASISDTMRALESKNMVIKNFDSGKSKNFTIELTAEGRGVAEKAVLYSQQILEAINRYPDKLKTTLFSFLGDILYNLHTSGMIPIQRMCQTCKYNSEIGNSSHCGLFNIKLGIEDLQVDCKDHKYS